MFTGLIEEIGIVLDISNQISTKKGENAEYRKFRIRASKIIKGLKIGDSISINGACQTVVKKSNFLTKLFTRLQWFEIESLVMTLEKTNFLQFKKGTCVNLERALLSSSRLGGHFVSGHVQTVASVQKIERIRKNTYLYIKVPTNILQFMMEEGSIALDGISLTIAKIENDSLMLNIIAHTFDNTNIKFLKKQDEMNVEVDLLVKYAQKLLEPLVLRR